MAIIPLVAETKLENDIPMFQPKREEEIFNSLQQFSLNTGLNPELLTDIYKRIIKDAQSIENNIIDGSTNIESSELNAKFLPLLESINNSIREYIILIEKMQFESSMHNKTENEFIKIFTGYYKEKIINEKSN